MRMAFKNMKAKIRREGITQRQIAESMSMSANNLSLKINERIPMTVDEAKFDELDKKLDAILKALG